MKTIIFDLDGTLINSLDDLANSCNYVLRKHGFKEHPREAYNYFVGNGITKLVERALPEEERTEDFIATFKKEFLDYYAEHKNDLTKPYEGVEVVLHHLQKKGYLLAVASNKEHNATNQLVKKFFPTISFAKVEGQKDNVPTKPHPAIIKGILTSTNTLKVEAMLVGDTSVDIQTAINSGITSVGVLWGFRTKEELEEAGANYIISEPSELIDILVK